MSSPALRHRAAKLEAIAAAGPAAADPATSGTARARLRGTAALAAQDGALPSNNPYEGPVAAQYQDLLIQRDDDLRKLHEIESIENKVAYKRDAIEKFLPWFESALKIEDDQQAVQDDILVTGLIWALDIKRWPLALDLAAHVIGHGLSLPEQYHRSAPGIVVSEIADAAIEEPGSVPHEILVAASAYVDPHFDMKDNYRARLHRALGESFALQAKEFDPASETAVAGGKSALIECAITELQRALKLDKGVGVKKHMEQLEREAKALAAAAGQQT